MRTNPGSHDAATRALHWLTALLVIVAAALALSIDAFDDDVQDRVRLVHEWAGVGVLLATLARALWIVARPARDVAVPLAARAMHLALVVLLALVPVLGWAYASAKGHAPMIGAVALPALLLPDLDAAERFHDWHAYAAWALLAAAGAHVLAALHHYVRRDEVLRAMLPWARTASVEQVNDP